MSEFRLPLGTNFSSEREIPASSLANALLITVGFIQEHDPYARLRRYDDWWEHDGLHFFREAMSIHQLFEIVKSPQALLEAMPGDLDVFVGVAPEDEAWYLRFYISWDEEGYELLGRFDFTLRPDLETRFRDESTRMDVKLLEQDSEKYFRSTIL